MTPLRKAARQALEALEDLLGWQSLAPQTIQEAAKGRAAALRAALAEPPINQCAETCERAKLCAVCARGLAEPVQEPDLSRCPQCGGPADNGHDRSIPPNPYFCTKCMAEPEACPHGVTDGNCKECYGGATNSEPFTVFTTLRQREWPALWTGCPNCASLQDQNTELDRKLAELTSAVLRANGIGASDAL